MAVYTTIDDAGAYFKTVLYTGTGSSLGVTGVGFQPDFTWIKNKDASDFHVLTDAVRGVTKYISCNADTAETTNAESLKTFDSDGFTVGTQAEVNTNTEKYVSWNWKAGTTTGIGAGSQTITPTAYSINTTSGIGIYAYTANNTQGATISHGLGTAPKMMLFKKLNGAADWKVYHVSVGNTQAMILNDNSVPTTDGGFFDDTTPTSTLITFGNDAGINGGTNQFVCYAFTDIAGYSQFSSYKGNGNADGAFIYTGFRPAFVMVKRTDSTSNWGMFDDKRDPYNVVENTQFAASATTDDTTTDRMDFYSNGFKNRTSDASWNTTGDYIYMAFAESPFVNSSGGPSNAR